MDTSVISVFSAADIIWVLTDDLDFSLELDLALFTCMITVILLLLLGKEMKRKITE